MSILLMFSGGKDSFITACKLVDAGDTVNIIGFNGGCLLGEKNILETAERLHKKYKDKINIIGLRGCMATRMNIDKQWKEFTSKELFEDYPHVTGLQAQCFFCQTSMWLESIGYCIAKNINAIACGYKNTDLFCTGSERYLDFIQNICSEYGIEVKTPMWNFVDYEDGLDRRDSEMILRKFLPSVLEPKCAVGIPANGKIDKNEIEELIRYFNAYVQYRPIIKKLSRILGTIKIDDESYM